MFNKLTVVHVVVNDAEQAAKDYAENFGLEVTNKVDKSEQGFRAVAMALGNSAIEFLEPLGDDQGPLRKFLGSRGEGVYMMGWEVDDVEQTVTELQAKGIRLLNAEPEARAAGLNTFIHPKFAHGVLVELIEKAN